MIIIIIVLAGLHHQCTTTTTTNREDAAPCQWINVIYSSNYYGLRCGSPKVGMYWLA
jgi:hypothetical protein